MECGGLPPLSYAPACRVGLDSVPRHNAASTSEILMDVNKAI
jgi:hypothetical protein